MNVYTASKFENHAAVRAFNDKVREAGHKVTWDWTRTKEFNFFGEPIGTGLSERDREMYGMLDYAGVMQADVVILLDLDMALNGARWEAGMAIGNGAQVWIVSYHHKVIFDVLPRVTVLDTEDDALRLLAGAVTVA